MDKGIREHHTPLQASRPSTPHRSPPLFDPPGSPPSPPSPDSNQSNAGQSSPVGEAFPMAHYPKIRTALCFIDGVRSADLASQFDPEELQELLDPQEHATTPLDDPSLRLSLLNYISLIGSSRVSGILQKFRSFRPISLLSFLTYLLLSYFVRLHCANIHTPLSFFLIFTTQNIKTRNSNLLGAREDH